MPFACTGHCFVVSRCKGVVGAFKRGLGFDGIAGGMRQSACVTVVVKFRLLGPAHLITCLCVLEIWRLVLPLIGNAPIEHKVVGCDSAALGIISLTNVVIVGLGQVWG